MGFVYYSTNDAGQDSQAIVAGALPDGAQDVTIVDNAGNVTRIAPTAGGGYWTQVTSPARMSWKAADGTTRQITFRRFGLGNAP